MGISQPPISQDIDVRDLGWDQGAQITVEQDLPRPLTILGIFGELSQEAIDG